MESISCILYFLPKLEKLGVQCFKWCMNWSSNEEVMAVWRQPHQVVWKFCSCEMSCENFVAQSPFRSCELKFTCEISQGVSQQKNHLQAHLSHFASWNSIFVVANHVAKSPPSCETSCKSPPSCKITNSTCKIKVQTCKMDNSTCESPWEMHLCNLR